jgi:Flp pilus assembly protein TadG
MLLQLKTTLTQATRRALPLHVRRLAQRDDGAAAVEFGLVAAPFLALVFAIIETSLIFFTTQSLEKATADAARLIMTGQQQSAPVPQGSNPIVEFKKKLCNPNPAEGETKVLLPMFNCANLTVEVKSANSDGYSSQSATNSGLGGPGCIMTVQVSYKWPVFVSLYNLSFALAGGKADGKHDMKATAVFRNEPYGNPTPC